MPGLRASEGLFRAESKKLLSLNNSKRSILKIEEITSSRRLAGFFLWAVLKFGNDLTWFDSGQKKTSVLKECFLC